MYNGQGKLINYEGEVYEGAFKDNKMEGHGKMTYPDGSVYVGQFQDDKKHGQGKMTNPDGSVQEGTWVQGKRGWPVYNLYICVFKTLILRIFLNFLKFHNY